MASAKRHTTSNSGSSARSTKKATSRQPGSSSATAPASFEQVFGKGANEKAKKLQTQLGRTLRSLEELDTLGEPSMALYRARHRQRRRQLLRYAEALREAIRHETDTTS
jgi:hypothetical protein